jgi:hypothetical protein
LVRGGGNLDTLGGLVQTLKKTTIFLAYDYDAIMTITYQPGPTRTFIVKREEYTC